jgi:hypothetical protein
MISSEYVSSMDSSGNRSLRQLFYALALLWLIQEYICKCIQPSRSLLDLSLAVSMHLFGTSLET